MNTATLAERLGLVSSHEVERLGHRLLEQISELAPRGMSQLLLVDPSSGQGKLLGDFSSLVVDEADIYKAGLVLPFPDAKTRGYGI